MKIEVVARTELLDTYRTNRVRSMFNVNPEQASEHRVSLDLPLEEKPWKVGLIVGPSGSGKTTLGRQLLSEASFFKGYDWPTDRPIVDAMGPERSFDDVTGALGS